MCTLSCYWWFWIEQKGNATWRTLSYLCQTHRVPFVFRKSCLVPLDFEQTTGTHMLKYLQQSRIFIQALRLPKRKEPWSTTLCQVHFFCLDRGVTCRIYHFFQEQHSLPSHFWTQFTLLTMSARLCIAPVISLGRRKVKGECSWC